MAKNRFEQVDEVQPDAITLTLWKGETEGSGHVTCPAAISGGQFDADMTSKTFPAKDAFRSAVRLANEIKAAVVVIDPDSLWDSEWGNLYRPVD
jgi:hypothetical protein